MNRCSREQVFIITRRDAGVKKDLWGAGEVEWAEIDYR